MRRTTLALLTVLLIAWVVVAWPAFSTASWLWTMWYLTVAGCCGGVLYGLWRGSLEEGR